MAPTLADPTDITLVDPMGRPIRPHTKPEVTPTPLIPADAMSAFRDKVYGPQSQGLTPQRLAVLLQAAAAGDMLSLLTVAEELEEKDSRYAACLTQRKLAVLARKMAIVPRDKDDATSATWAGIANDLIVKRRGFRSAVFDLMDAVSKGYSIVEPYWGTTRHKGRLLWAPAGYNFVDPRWCEFDRGTLRILGLKTLVPALEPILPIVEGEFLHHRPRTKTGGPTRNGLARSVIPLWMLKAMNLRDWAAFAQKYGIPIMYLEHNPDITTKTSRGALVNVLQTLQRDGVAVLPAGLELHIVDGTTARGNQVGDRGPHFSFVSYVDRQLASLVLGQHMTMDDGSSRSQAEVHERVAHTYMESDCRDLEETFQPLLDIFVQYNAPAGVEIQLQIDTEPEEDLKAFTEAIMPWVEKAGLKVSASQLRTKFGLEEPDGDDDTLELRPPPMIPAQPGQAPPGAPGAGGRAIAPNTAEIREHILELMSASLYTPWQANAIAAALRANTAEEFVETVGETMSTTDASRFTRQLAIHATEVELEERGDRGN